MITLKYGKPITAEHITDASEFYGLSTDTKPVGTLSPSGFKIPNGAAFLEINTGDIYLYNAAATPGSEWVKLGGNA